MFCCYVYVSFCNALACVVIMLLSYVAGVLLCCHVTVLLLWYCYICSTVVTVAIVVAIGDARGH